MARKKAHPSPEAAGKRDKAKIAERYTHPTQTSPMRPDVGTQPQFRKKKPPTTWRYDSSLSPALDWDGQNGRWGFRLARSVTAVREIPDPFTPRG